MVLRLMAEVIAKLFRKVLIGHYNNPKLLIINKNSAPLSSLFRTIQNSPACRREGLT
jgi:hypothetical protein